MYVSIFGWYPVLNVSEVPKFQHRMLPLHNLRFIPVCHPSKSYIFKRNEANKFYIVLNFFLSIAVHNLMTPNRIGYKCNGYVARMEAYVTVYGKSRHMGFSVKIEFDVSLISSTLELPHLQV